MREKISEEEKRMHIIVRSAIERDYQDVCRLFEEGDALHSEVVPQVFRKPVGPTRTEEFFSSLLQDENGILFVAEFRKQVVGLVHVFLRESSDMPIMVPRKYAYIGDLVVSEKHRRQGIGEALMNQAQNWAVQRKVFQLELNVWDFNRHAINLFKKLGYSMSRHQMWKLIED
jgi:ribosomal protein S18 acetylase RimI-like enzyme